MRVLMCNPKHYRIGANSPELNPYMNTAVQPDIDLAYRQFYRLVELYSRLGIETFFLKPQKTLFDQVFTANVAWGVNGKFVMANMRPEWRRAETQIAAEWFKTNGFQVAEPLPESAFFEGQGDVTTTKEAHLYCYGIRNNIEAAEEIAWRLNLSKPIIPLRLVSKNFYHGDVCLRYLGTESDKIIWNPAAFDRQSGKNIKLFFGKRALAVDENFAVQKLPDGRFNFPLNGVYHNGTVTFPWDSRCGRFPEEVRRFAEEGGSRVVLLDFSEFGLSGAGHRCCTLFLD